MSEKEPGIRTIIGRILIDEQEEGERGVTNMGETEMEDSGRQSKGQKVNGKVRLLMDFIKEKG